VPGVEPPLRQAPPRHKWPSPQQAGPCPRNAYPTQMSAAACPEECNNAPSNSIGHPQTPQRYVRHGVDEVSWCGKACAMIASQSCSAFSGYALCRLGRTPCRDICLKNHPSLGDPLREAIRQLLATPFLSHVPSLILGQGPLWPQIRHLSLQPPLPHQDLRPNSAAERRVSPGESPHPHLQPIAIRYCYPASQNSSARSRAIEIVASPSSI
jgi:hypothetical protein